MVVDSVESRQFRTQAGHEVNACVGRAVAIAIAKCRQERGVDNIRVCRSTHSSPITLHSLSAKTVVLPPLSASMRSIGWVGGPGMSIGSEPR